MPQQYILINRPVIGTKRKINDISQGGPPNPIRSEGSMSPYISGLVTKGLMCTKHGDSIHSCHKLEAAVSLMEYQKTVHDNLISINNNISDMLKETSSGIDVICQKVRMCLLDANSVSTIKRHSSKQLMRICEENLDKVEDIEEETIAEIVEEGNCDEDDEIGTTGTQTRNSAVKGLWSITSKLGLSQKCTAENFQKSMQEVAKLNNYEDFLSSMVNDVDEGINRDYMKYKKKHKSKVNGNTSDKILNYSSSKSRNSRSMYQMGTIKKKDKINTLQNNELTGMEEDFNENQDTRTRRQTAPSTINEKIQKLQNALKIHAAKKKVDISLADITFPCGEVYRKRAFTDLNKRMIMQIQANDSLICFQKLMDKNNKFMQKMKNGKPSSEMSFIRSPLQQILKNEQFQRQNQRNTNLAKMYQDSLWFKNKIREEKRSKKESRSKKKVEIKSSKNEKYLHKTVQSVSNVQAKSHSGMRNSSKHSTSSVASVNTSSAAKIPKSHSKMRNSAKRSTSSVASVNSSVAKIPTKYQVSITNNQPLSEPERCKMHWMRSKYAQMSKKRLQYMDILEDITDKDILPLKSEYPRRDEAVSREKPKEKIESVKNSYLYKLLHATENEKVWTDLLKPNTNENCSKTEFLERATNTSRGKDKLRRSLSKYIFADIDQIRRNQVYTVMPVQIYYDNSRIAAGPARKSQLVPQKLPPLPMKEMKGDIRLAEWCLENKKPKPMKIVYDPILRKIENDIKIVSARQQESKRMTQKLSSTASWSPKYFNQLFTTSSHQSSGFKTKKVDSLDKALKKPQPKIVPNQICKAAKNMERRSRKRNVASTEQSSVKLDVEKKIQKEVEIQSLKLRNVQERKIWENKYGKSVGQKLLNFVEKQPAAYEIPVPKYALPKTIKDPIRQREMLEKLQELKQKNDSIQNNIVKAIQVIENKMIDVLCKPAESIDAFEKMEKEITQVLSLMKTCKEGSQQEALPQIGEPYSDVTQLSEDLFKRLDKILEESGNAEKSSNRKSKRKMKAIGSQKSSGSDMQSVCFGSLSPSGIEKFKVTAISPKRSNQSSIIPRPKIIMPTVTTDEEFETIQSKLRELKNDLGLQGMLDIEESKPEKQFEQKTMPITETVINIAFVEHKHAGDNMKEYSEAESPLPSIDDGRSEKCMSENFKESTESLPANDPDEKYSSPCVSASIQEVGCGNQQSLNNDMQQLDSQEVAEDEKNPMEAFVDQSEQYYTPITSPLGGIRDTEAIQQIEPHNIDSELPEPMEEFNGLASSADRDCFYDNVNKVIARVESVYNQLAQFEEVSLDGLQNPEQKVPNIPVFHDPPKIEDFEADSFLTPFMHAVKDLRKSVTESPKSTPSSPRLYRSPSYFNVLSFLETLSDLDERVVEIRAARVHHYAYSCRNSTVFRQAIIQNQCVKSTSTIQNEGKKMPKKISCLKSPSSIKAVSTDQSKGVETKVVKKISSCLKKPPSPPSETITASKSKQKVSFSLQKEEKATQAVECLVPKLSSQESFSSLIIINNKKDEQVSAALDALECKSVDKMSLSYDDDSFKSNFEFNDEISPKPGPILQNSLETAENDTSKEKCKDNIHNDYKQTDKAEENFDYQTQIINGKFNETSILQAKKYLARNAYFIKQDGIDKIFENIRLESILKQMLKDSSLVEPLKDSIDTKLSEDTIEKTQKIRIMHQKSEILTDNKNEKCWERETFLKGVYICVYLFMFTALKLNLNLECSVD
ncbi:unnamed protein product [Ceutorhynchus assimilis]|uniref:Uncharacterized protein n=1 Tax=Ceutorhynchus assimilis TaxID=467358 RepID=A0A9N9QQ63_9CUCU|nr:unnamed protein product [Ceutorhynchus assimilis]